MRGLVTAMVTGGVLAGINTSLGNAGVTGASGAPWNSINASSPFMDQLQRNLTQELSSSVIRTAVAGGNSEDYARGLQTGLLNGFINTGAAQGANAIGDRASGPSPSLNAFTHSFAHFIAGCVGGAASASVAGGSASGGCTSGGVGAVVGEMGAQFFNPDGTRSAQDTINFSRLMAGIGGALVGGNVNLAAAAGGNAAENNYLSHNPVRGGQLRGFSEDLRRCRATAGCNVDGVYAYWSDISRSQQGAAQTAVAGDFGALGTLTPGLVGALGANPRDFCDSGDTRCYNFITSNNNQAFSVVATANALDGSGPRPQATPATAPATTPAANNSLAGSTVTRGQGGTGPVIGELLPDGSVAIRPVGPQALTGPSSSNSGNAGTVVVTGTGNVPNAQPSALAATNPLALPPHAGYTTASAFYQTAGWANPRIQSHLSGIDFSQPVEAVILPAGTTVVQYQIPGNPTGNYFAPIGTPAGAIGVDPTGRIATTFTTTGDVIVLRSTAANTSQNFNIPPLARGQGGGTQFFTTNPSAFRRNP